MSLDEDEQEPKPADSDDTIVAADFEAADKPPPDAKPDAAVEMEPEKSASDRYLDDLMALPSDERRALLSKIETRHEEAGESDTLPWKERQDDELAAKTAAASADAGRERREQQIRSWQFNASTARENIERTVIDLGERWEKRGIDDPAPRHDAAKLAKDMADLTAAEAGLLSHEAISEIGGGMTDGIAEHGGPITAEELGRVTVGTRREMARGYMGILADRVRKDTTVEVEKDMDKRIKEAVALEVGAKAADANRKVKVAPEATGKSAQTTDLTIEEIDEGLRTGPTSEIDSLLEKREKILAQ